MKKYAVFDIEKNEVKDVVPDTEEYEEYMRNFKNKEKYALINVPDDLKDFPVKVVKTLIENKETYEVSIDKTIINNLLPDFIISVRQKRNNMLKETDFLLLEDVESDKTKAKAYRKYLRDFPQNITVDYLIQSGMNIEILSYNDYVIDI